MCYIKTHLLHVVRPGTYKSTWHCVGSYLCCTKLLNLVIVSAWHLANVLNVSRFG